jgi:tetratricopeptide (TPR) repeat protein
MKTDVRSLTPIAILTAALLFAPGCQSPSVTDAGGSGSWTAADPPSADYVLDVGVGIDGGAASLAAAGSISLTNTTRRPITVLAFEWTVRTGAEFSLRVGGRPLEVLNAAKNMPPTTPLLLALPAPVPPGGRIRADVRFTTRAAVNEGQVHFGLWYPRLWREGRPVRDTFRVRLAVPPGFVAATSGRLDPASGAYLNDCVTTHFGLFLSNSLQVERREAGGVEISALFTEKGRACARHCLDAAADIVPFYRSWLGVYPHRSLVILPGGDQPMGGYPYASGMVVIHGQETFDPDKGERSRNWWTWITAHEIGHQYWGEFVMSADVTSHYTDAWLMIGLGICADKAYMLGTGRGWDRHRGFLDGYLAGARAGNDTTLDAPPSLVKLQRYDRNNVLIHGKGFTVLSALETALGAPAFDRLYRRAVREFAGRRLGWKEFQRLAEGESGQGLDWFFEDWVRSAKMLECRVTSKTSSPRPDGFLSEVRVEYGPDSIRMPVPVRAVFEDGTVRTASTDRLVRENVLRFSGRSPLREVVLDPDKRLALVEDPIPQTAARIEEAVRALDWTGTGAQALECFKNPAAAAVRTPRFWFKLGLLLFDGGTYPESLAAFRTCREVSTEKGDLFGALVWIGLINDLLGERDAAVAAYREALKEDPGRRLQHDQYGLRIDRAWVEERLTAPFTWGR